VHIVDGEDELDLHFVHAKSPRKDAVPLLMMHGWPGTVFDFHKVMEPLLNPPRSEDPAFHVVLPSLPGYLLSTLPQREGWTLFDTARIMHRLMTEILGYKTFAGQGGDWGSYLLWIMGSLYPESIPTMHFNMFRCPPIPGISPDSFSDTEKRLLARNAEFAATGRGYLDIQSTKPFTIGLAIGSSPLAMLTYIGEKMYVWSDPERVDPSDILDTVALYFLSRTFATSVLIYNQSSVVRTELTTDPTKWRLQGKIGYSAFPYEIGGSPRAYIKAVGPLVYYKEHEHGGHFPALDNPEEFVGDLREFFGAHWSTL